MVYYNEIDPFAAAWLRELIKAGLIADGEVDERSIEDVLPSELAGFTQCHFFAGIGVWSYALRQAGWPDDRPIWTGSCPCQPFSAAGKRKGFDDKRHLWPEFFRLIRECRPVTVLGEQVASKDGLAWLDALYTDLEGAHYACGAVDTCASGFGAPHIRQRLYWMAHAMPKGLQRGDSWRQDTQRQVVNGLAGCGGTVSRMENAEQFGRRGRSASDDTRQGREVQAKRHGTACDRPGSTNGFWANPDWLLCKDGKWRPIKPGVAALADGIAARVPKLRGLGNSLCAPQAQAFIESVMEVI